MSSNPLDIRHLGSERLQTLDAVDDTRFDGNLRRALVKVL